MKACLSVMGFVSYGAAVLRGKAVAVVIAGGLVVGSSIVMAIPVAAGQVTVTALGDSLTAGYGLRSEDGLVPQLQSWLDAAGADVVLINAGVSGDTTAGGAARVGWSLADKPDAMIVALGGNDVLRGLNPAASKANLARILDATRAAGVKVLLVGLVAPNNYGAEYKAQFNAIYSDLAADYDVLLYENFFRGMGARTQDEVRMLMQADGIHPNKDGVARIAAALGPSVLELIGRVNGGGS